MADERAPRKPKEEEPPAEPTTQAKPSGALGSLLRWSGLFMLSFAVILTAMFFVVRQRLASPQAPASEEVAATVPAGVADPVEDEASADSLAEPPDSLQQRVGELERLVGEREQRLQALDDSTARMAGRLSQLRRELEAHQQRELELSSEEILKLSRVFESMQPAKAAPVLLKMDNASVASILLAINERTAAKVLASMPPERAAGISSLIRQRAEQKLRDEARRNP
jgi:flagellar motility protein MotE (MotC chaperone)